MGGSVGGGHPWRGALRPSMSSSSRLGRGVIRLVDQQSRGLRHGPLLTRQARLSL